MLEAIAKVLMSMGFGQYALILLIISIFIDITPGIKINPIKAIFRFIGKYFNSSIEKEITEFKKDVQSQFDELKKEQEVQSETLNKLAKDQDNKEISSLCWSIIDFQNSIVNGSKHTREQYRHILDSSKKYMRMAAEPNADIKQEDMDLIKEYTNFIQEHYENERKDQTKLYF